MSWDKIKELNVSLFTMIEDVKHKPLDVTSGFIVVGGIIVVIIVGAFAARFYNYKVNKKLIWN
jgi:hypothetical protein